MKMIPVTAAALLLATAACGPRIQPLRPIMDNGQIIPPRSEEVVGQARVDGEMERERLAQERGAAMAAALATCAPAICEAVARGELALGMNESQVLAATGTSPAAWQFRGTQEATSMAPRFDAPAPRDGVGEISFVNLYDGFVRSYTYREPQGFRTVATPADEVPAGRLAAQADALLRQGDEYVLAGDLTRALDRYDRADILRPNHPETTLRIATTLDKSLRPLEAIMRYQLFIHQMELERIRARGEAAAHIAEAIARAQQRIIILERQR